MFFHRGTNILRKLSECGCMSARIVQARGNWQFCGGTTNRSSLFGPSQAVAALIGALGNSLHQGDRVPRKRRILNVMDSTESPTEINELMNTLTLYGE